MAPRLSGPTYSRSTRSASDRPLELRASPLASPSATGEQKEDRATRPSAAARKRVRSPRTDRATGRRRWRARPASRQREPPKRFGQQRRACADRSLESRLRQECDLERAAPRRRQRRQDPLEHVLEQVAEAGVSEPPLQFRRPRYEDTRSSFTRGLDTRQPESRLSDPRLALEHQCRRVLGVAFEECVDGVELRISADDRA